MRFLSLKKTRTWYNIKNEATFLNEIGYTIPTHVGLFSLAKTLGYRAGCMFGRLILSPSRKRMQDNQSVWWYLTKIWKVIFRGVCMLVLHLIMDMGWHQGGQHETNENKYWRVVWHDECVLQIHPNHALLHIACLGTHISIFWETAPSLELISVWPIFLSYWDVERPYKAMRFHLNLMRLVLNETRTRRNINIL